MPSLEASLLNLEQAKAAWRRPRPWRSAHETRVIRGLVWQWFNYRGPGRWSGRAVARRLGVTHTYIQKLVREFVTDPTKIRREARNHVAATFDQLDRTQEETRRQGDRGWLLSPRRWRVAEIKIGDQVVRDVVRTKASLERERYNRNIPHEVPIWATGMSYYSAENPCDPLIAVRHAMQHSREPEPAPIWLRSRWRPGRRWPRQ
jgi:hypothetical protein